MPIRPVALFASQIIATAAMGADPTLITSGKTAFQSCAACHSVVPGQARMGPNLAGVVGRQAGTVQGYVYSTAMAKAGYKWDAAHLDAFIAAPAKMVPGTRMAYRGVDDAARRQAIIAYLSSIAGR